MTRRVAPEVRPQASSEPAGAIEIRPATDADAEAMVDLEVASAVHHASVDPDRWRVPARDAVATYRQRRREADPDGAALVAVIDGRVVGMVEMVLRGFISDPGGARVPIPSVDLGLSVAPEWRGHGIGTALMRAAEDWARKHGATRVILDVATANTGAVRLYERLGYEAHGLLMDRRLDADAGPRRGGRPAVVSMPGRDAGPARAGGPGSPVNGGQDGERTGAADVVPTLRGEHVLLRPLVESDRDALLEVLSDPSVASVWDTRGPSVSADELIAGDEGWMVWAIEVEGRLAGSIQAAEEVDDPDYRRAGIDIFLWTPFQGRGLGTDAIRTVARYLIDVRGHHRLTIDPAAANARAIRTYENVGFRPVGVMRQYERARDGTFHDGLLMDMLAGELR